MSSTPRPTASILIASDDATDAALVKKLLTDSFDNVFTSTDAERAADDFERRAPQVLVLAFKEVAKAERYCLGLYRHSGKIHLQPHRTVILCDKEEVRQVADLCISQSFDDYVLFWPLNHDAQRLRMSVHHALRALAGLEFGRPSVAEFAAQAQRLTALQTLVDQSTAASGQRVDVAGLAPAQAETDQPPPTVLLVDDDRFQHKIVAKILEAENCRLVFAASAAEALEVMGRHRPELVLMDVQMADMDGIEATRRLKAMPAFSQVPVIMITGKSEGTVVVDSLKAGAADFVVKPFDRSKLIAKVARWLPSERPRT